MRVDSTSVVSNPHAQASVRIFKFELNAVRSGMTICVEQGLFANAISLMLDGWAQRLLAAGNNDAKVDIALDR
jgi:hypothetical protein